MTEFLVGAAAFILAMVALGLLRILRGPGNADRIMAAQLLGTGGIAAVLLLGTATGEARYAGRCLDAGAAGGVRRLRFRQGEACADTRRVPDRGQSMKLFLDLWTVVAVVAGAFFFFAGTVGLLRFPDSLTRLHALSKADNLGLGLVVLGLLPQMDSVSAGLKIVGIWLLVLLSGATAAQWIARTLRHSGPGP